jgi:hypothetical protein
MAKEVIRNSLDEIIKLMDIEERKADSSIKGYFFQINLTLYRVLSSAIATTEHYIEKIEDILEREDLVKVDGKINIIQVKHHETTTTDSKYTEPLLYFYKNFLIAKNGGLAESFKFTLIKYDFSGDKDVETILSAGLISRAKKNIELQEEISEIISKIGIPKILLEKEFISNCEIITSLDMESIMGKNVDLIRGLFEGDNEKITLAESFYAWAWKYVIDNFSNSDFYLTKKKLIEMFSQKAEEIQNSLVDQSWLQMKESLSQLGANVQTIGVDITTIKEDISHIRKDSDVELNLEIKFFISNLIDELKEAINNDDYDEEFADIEFLSDELLKMLDEIKNLILDNIEGSDEEKYYFLISLIPESINKEDFLRNKMTFFYKHTHNIETFVRRLLKIYFYKKHIEKTVSDCSELFAFVGNGHWMLKAKNADTNTEYYVNLLGGHDKSSRVSGLNTLMKKYLFCYDNNFPDLILFKGNKKGNISKIDISKGESNNIRTIKRRIDRKNKDLLLKCITCLKDDDFGNYSDCANIFKFGCEIELWKN